MLKATLHVHIQGDHDDYILYNGFQFLNEAARKNFDVVAFTAHERVIVTEELKNYAKNLGILLIPGIELNLGGHVLVLNADREAEKLKTLEDLKNYKIKRPEIFTIAAHPFFPHRRFCLQERINEGLEIFDAIEHSWFYSRWIDWNKKAKKIAELNKKPYIATSDIHMLSMIKNGHVLIDAEKNAESIFEALRNHQFQSISKPKSLFSMWWTFAKMNIVQWTRVLPWMPPHVVFNHENIPRSHQNLRPQRPETNRVSGRERRPHPESH